MGNGGISHVELLILYERWAGERLRIEDSVPDYRRPGGPVPVSAALLCPDVDIWRLCQYLGRMMRASCHLPGGLGRFVPGRIGANHIRLRHIGWGKCCHGLTCRPLESSGEGFLSDLLSLLGYPVGADAALLKSTLELEYHTFPFARRKPSWRVPTRGHVADILAAGGEEVGLARAVSWGRGSVSLIKVARGSDLLADT